MGGCRCTYKNCTIRSDGKTHLFHYPVFDKVRCHEWLTRAGRYDFLNLKVSQLKNRCICQHHFADNWFMNDKKDKLKSKAVPTLDGPFCDTSKYVDTEMPQNMLGLYPLPCEVMENDDFVDRKSNYNLLYADFLTNDPMDSYKIIDVDSKNFTNIENVTPQTNNSITEIYTHKTRDDTIMKPMFNQITKPKNNAVQEIEVEVPLFTNEQNNAIVAKEEFPPQDVKPPLLELGKTRSKVRIISEKKITEPEKKICVPVSSAAFEVVKPSMILSINKNKLTNQANESVPLLNKVNEKPNILNNVQKNLNNVVDEIIMSFDNDKEGPITLNNMATSSKQDENNITEMVSMNHPSGFDLQVNVNTSNPSVSVRTPQKKEGHKKPNIKNKISPERVAAINEKRKFNMKLKDIIAGELSRIDDQDPADKEDILVPRKSQNKYKHGSERVRNSLSKEPSLLNKNAYIVHYLEARMEKMENLLLNKIDQNTKKIMDLKRTLETQEDDQPQSKKSSVKSNLSEEAHKKQLYKEISKYLTPDCNSLLYEELFINKFHPNEAKAAPTPAKRKRNR